ncbi:hypothetical protein ACSLVQ_29195, partial [Klebsiella pneumoniae]|uniref:hypothetical protein n=1 Tax=Klebsiella pneumoniae TaxID=573 RepID=UPI003EE1D1AC
DRGARSVVERWRGGRTKRFHSSGDTQEQVFALQTVPSPQPPRQHAPLQNPWLHRAPTPQPPQESVPPQPSSIVPHELSSHFAVGL